MSGSESRYFICPVCSSAVGSVAFACDISCVSCNYQIPLRDGYYDFLDANSELPGFDWLRKDSYVEICRGGGSESPWIHSNTLSARELLEQQDRCIKESLIQRRVELLVDISGGCGAQLSKVAPYAIQAIHWEAHRASVVAAVAHYLKNGIENVFVCRGAYFVLHIRPSSADVVICFDTVERGEEHDRLVLVNVRALLKPDGIALVDHHNRGGDDSSTRQYTHKQFEELAGEAGLQIEKTWPAAYGPTVRAKGGLVWHLIRAYAKATNQPARLIHRLRRKAA